jgi:hypothetical protein
VEPDPSAPRLGRAWVGPKRSGAGRGNCSRGPTTYACGPSSRYRPPGLTPHWPCAEAGHPRGRPLCHGRLEETENTSLPSGLARWRETSARLMSASGCDASADVTAMPMPVPMLVPISTRCSPSSNGALNTSCIRFAIDVALLVGSKVWTRTQTHHRRAVQRYRRT